MWNFLIVVLVTIVVGIVVHFMLTKWRGIHECEKCATSKKAKNIWNQLQGDSVTQVFPTAVDKDDDGDLSD
jgi:hypothetical protein